MRNFGHYLLAAALLLMTVPMYRYLLSRPSETNDSHSGINHEPASVEYSQAPVAAVEPRPLLAGELCMKGLVYISDKNEFRQAKGYGGVSVPCQGTHLVAAAYTSGTQIQAEQKMWYAYNEKLPVGYKCSAADGMVYRTRMENGATVLEPLVRSGVIVHCGGDMKSSHRY